MIISTRKTVMEAETAEIISRISTLKPNMPSLPSGFGKFSGIIYAIVVIIAVLVIAKPFIIINSGEVGIKSTAGNLIRHLLVQDFISLYLCTRSKSSRY